MRMEHDNPKQSANSTGIGMLDFSRVRAKVVSPNGKRTWKEHGANHYLDCEMLNASAAYMLQVHRLKPKGLRIS